MTKEYPNKIVLRAKDSRKIFVSVKADNKISTLIFVKVNKKDESSK